MAMAGVMGASAVAIGAYGVSTAVECVGYSTVQNTKLTLAPFRTLNFLGSRGLSPQGNT